LSEDITKISKGDCEVKEKLSINVDSILWSNRTTTLNINIILFLDECVIKSSTYFVGAIMTIGYQFKSNVGSPIFISTSWKTYG